MASVYAARISGAHASHTGLVGIGPLIYKPLGFQQEIASSFGEIETAFIVSD